MTLSQEITRARMLSRAALLTYHYPEYKTPVSRRDATKRFRQACIETWKSIKSRSGWNRIKKLADREIQSELDYLARDRKSELYSLEHRARRAEDREIWNSQGLRVFHVIDSYCFSTQPSPMYCAESSARRMIGVLEGLGIKAIQTCPDREIRDGWGVWGNYYSVSGHVVVLIQADTPMELELARRKYSAHMWQYWHDMYVKYGWDMSNFEEMHGREYFYEWR